MGRKIEEAVAYTEDIKPAPKAYIFQEVVMSLTTSNKKNMNRFKMLL